MFTLPMSLARRVRWIGNAICDGAPSSSVDCIATVSPVGGLQLDSSDGELTKQKNEFARLLKENSTTSLDSGEAFMPVVRYFATSWRLKLSHDSGSYKFTIPTDAVKLGFLPGADELVAVTVTNLEIIELVSASPNALPESPYSRLIMDVARDRENQVRAAIEMLKER